MIRILVLDNLDTLRSQQVEEALRIANRGHGMHGCIGEPLERARQGTVQATDIAGYEFECHAVRAVMRGTIDQNLVDRLEAAGIKAFGPNARGAEIEGSKGFMKDLCARYGIPTAAYGRFDEPDEAKEFIIRQGAPIVVKADGLAAGKGVILCRNENEAFAAIDHIMTEGAFGRAGAEVIIEEFLTGEEASFFALVNGTNVVPLASAQDHKAAYDGDEGPNTGGMGAYSPAPVVTDEMTDTILKRIIVPTVEAMAEENCPYKGVLYAGLMIAGGEPKVLEFNARFGDPECQPLIMRLKSDLLEALLACTEGRMDDMRLEWHEDPALVVVRRSSSSYWYSKLPSGPTDSK